MLQAKIDKAETETKKPVTVASKATKMRGGRSSQARPPLSSASSCARCWTRDPIRFPRPRPTHMPTYPMPTCLTLIYRMLTSLTLTCPKLRSEHARVHPRHRQGVILLKRMTKRSRSLGQSRAPRAQRPRRLTGQRTPHGRPSRALFPYRAKPQAQVLTASAAETMSADLSAARTTVRMS